MYNTKSYLSSRLFSPLILLLKIPLLIRPHQQVYQIITFIKRESFTFTSLVLPQASSSIFSLFRFRSPSLVHSKSMLFFIPIAPLLWRAFFVFWSFLRLNFGPQVDYSPQERCFVIRKGANNLNHAIHVFMTKHLHTTQRSIIPQEWSSFIWNGVFLSRPETTPSHNAVPR